MAEAVEVAAQRRLSMVSHHNPHPKKIRHKTTASREQAKQKKKVSCVIYTVRKHLVVVKSKNRLRHRVGPEYSSAQPTNMGNSTGKI